MGQTKHKIVPIPAYLTRAPAGNEKGYVRYTRSLHESDAIADLTDKAYRMYLDMLMFAAGRRQVIYSQSTAIERYVCRSKDGYTQAINQLITVGLIRRLPRSCYAASRYEFSDDWHRYVSPRRDPLTGELP